MRGQEHHRPPHGPVRWRRPCRLQATQRPETQQDRESSTLFNIFDRGLSISQLKRISLRKRFEFTVSVWSWQPQNLCIILTHFHRRAYRRGLSFLRSKKYLNAAIYPTLLPSLLDIFVIWVWRNGKTVF